MSNTNPKSSPKKKRTKLGALIRPDVTSLTDQTPLGVKMIEEAGKIHLRVNLTIANALVLAIEAGSRLQVAKSLVSHGQFTELVQKRFCEPNNASMRTAQRYMELAANKEKLLESIRSQGSIDLASKTDTEILANLSTRKALDEIKRLELSDKTETDKRAPNPCSNDWLIPEDLGSSIASFLGDQVVDVAGIEAFNPIHAKRVITPEEDALRPETTWGASVWVNPGFKKVSIDTWVEATLDRVQRGEVREALLLLPATPTASWAQRLNIYPYGFLITPLKVLRIPSKKYSLEATPSMIVPICNRDRTKVFTAIFDRFVSIFIPIPKGE